jgi:hypothetical protein
LQRTSSIIIPAEARSRKVKQNSKYQKLSIRASLSATQGRQTTIYVTKKHKKHKKIKYSADYFKKVGKIHFFSPPFASKNSLYV